MGGFNLPVFGGSPTYGSTFGNVSPSGGSGFNIMSLLPLLMGGAGALGSNTNFNQNGTSTTSGSTTGGSNFQSNPLLSGNAQTISNAYTNGLLNQYNQGVNLQPFQAAGQQAIAGQGRNNAATIANSLASRGLSYSPAAGTAETMNTLNTGNQQNQFMEQIPLLQHQLNQGNLQQLIQGFTALPYGQGGTTQTNQNQNSTTTNNVKSSQSTNPFAALLSGLGSGIGLLGML